MQTKSISIPVVIAENIIDLSNDLGGEKAMEDFGLFLSDTSDDELKAKASNSLLQFYAMAKTLSNFINRELTV